MGHPASTEKNKQNDPQQGDKKPLQERRAADDITLVKRSQNGDLEAYDELVRRYQERIYNIIYNMTANRDITDDLAQETFIKAFRAIKSFKGDSSFYTWLYRIAVNKTLNHIKNRKEGIAMSLNSVDINVENHPDLVSLINDKTPLREINLNEIQEKLNIALLKLSEKHRLVVIMHDVEGMSHDEIAKILDCNSGTVRSRLFYARQQLQQLLSDLLK
ncbi:MAG TPA: sigma-70 family RNA polymerase sigma factor [Verrucomicrobiota bacterium]|nr:sigma-70 family RNA polymerase sigma factor [Verrucomicrobiota bacterium]